MKAVRAGLFIGLWAFLGFSVENLSLTLNPGAICILPEIGSEAQALGWNMQYVHIRTPVIWILFYKSETFYFFLDYSNTFAA